MNHIPSLGVSAAEFVASLMNIKDAEVRESLWNEATDICYRAMYQVSIEQDIVPMIRETYDKFVNEQYEKGLKLLEYKLDDE